jgi:hypothetical protein
VNSDQTRRFCTNKKQRLHGLYKTFSADDARGALHLPPMTLAWKVVS